MKPDFSAIAMLEHKKYGWSFEERQHVAAIHFGFGYAQNCCKVSSVNWWSLNSPDRRKGETCPFSEMKTAEESAPEATIDQAVMSSMGRKCQFIKFRLNVLRRFIIMA